MANKKISQLTSLGSVGVGTTDYFVVADDIGGGNYATVKCEPNKVSEYVLNPVTATQISGVNKNVYLDNGSNWDTASAVVTQNPYLQVRATDGKLVTGSGIGNAVGGDDMGNCVATQELYMQANNITGGHGLYFGDSTSNAYDSRSFIDTQEDFYGNPLWVKAYTDLTLSGNRFVRVSGQALDLVNTPLSGDVRITGGDLVIDHDNKLIVNEISGAKGSLATDDASLIINGASSHPPHQFNNYQSNNYCSVHWSDSNIQYQVLSYGTQDFYVDMYYAADGQTLTFYMQNDQSASLNPTFRFPSDGSFNVKWGDQYAGGNGPNIEGNTTSVFTFVRFGDDIFCSAITGYAN